MTDNNYPWGTSKPYNDFSSQFKKTFEQRVQKVSIDAGFTCPNRDGSKAVGGCTYCNNESFNPAYCTPTKSISQQVEEGIAFFSKKYKAQKYLAYFQAFSNTYAPLSHLKKIYEEALENPNVVGLVIGTRPDCISVEILDYLETLAKDYYISVEYGVESCNNKALEAINRGHTYQEAEKTILMSANRGIHIGVHLVNGLPFDTPELMLEHSVRVSRLPIESLKMHQLQILNKTKMALDYKKNPDQYHLFQMQEYLDFVVDVIERISPDVMIDRFINQAPPGWLIAPKWGGVKNFEFVAKVEKLLKTRNTWQGKLFVD